MAGMQFRLPLAAIERRDSSPSLALSPLTTARTGFGYEVKPSTNRESVYSEDAISTAPQSTARSSMVMAKLDISDFLAPLEARIFARLDAIEASFEHRVGALEHRSGAGSAGVVAFAAADDVQRQFDELRKELVDVRAQVDATSGKGNARAAEFSELIKASDEKRAALRNDIDEVWRQLKADRHQSHAKYQELADAMENQANRIADAARGPAALCLDEADAEALGVPPPPPCDPQALMRARSTPHVGQAPMTARERAPHTTVVRPSMSVGALSPPGTPHGASPHQPLLSGPPRTARALSPRSQALASRPAGVAAAVASAAKTRSPSPSAATGAALTTARPALERRCTAPPESVQRMCAGGPPPQRLGGAARGGAPAPLGSARSPLHQR